MTEQQSAPPGWYPTGDGSTRWWDGAQWTEQVQPEAPAKHRPALGCATLAALALVVMLAFFAIAGSSLPDGEDGGPDAAILMCQQFLADELKAPTTARYSQMQAFGEEPRWVVTGVVDAENSFGAPVRSGVTCSLLHEVGTDRWKASQVTALERISDELARELASQPFDPK